jgi:hypothetical protein
MLSRFISKQPVCDIFDKKNTAQFYIVDTILFPDGNIYSIKTKKNSKCNIFYVDNLTDLDKCSCSTLLIILWEWKRGFVDRRLIVGGTVSRKNTVGEKSVVQKIGFQTKRK